MHFDYIAGQGAGAFAGLEHAVDQAAGRANRARLFGGGISDRVGGAGQGGAKKDGGQGEKACFHAMRGKSVKNAILAGIAVCAALAFRPAKRSRA